MNPLLTRARLMICMLIIGSGQPATGAVKEIVPNLDVRWRHYLRQDAAKIPVISYPYDHCFRSAASDNGLPLSLLLAVARGESNFNPRARSDRNCHGLMQIQWPGTARHLGIYRLVTLYEPCTNIRAGARYLRELLDRYDGNLHLALAAYNYGPSRIKHGAGPDQIPRGAQWYSGYIYHHLNYVMRGAASAVKDASGGSQPYHGQKRLVLITFNQPFRADAYYQHLQHKAPTVDLDWYRVGLGRYQVVMLYSDAESLEQGRKKLRRMGVIIPSRR